LRLGADGSGDQGVGTLLCRGRAGGRVLLARGAAHRGRPARELIARDLRAALGCDPGRVSPIAADPDGASCASEGVAVGSAGVRRLRVAREHRHNPSFGGCAEPRLGGTMCSVREAG
jgi:hypothetical protein